MPVVRVRHLILLALLAALAGGEAALSQTIAPGTGQSDLSGMWRPLPRNQGGSGLDGDYAGLPMNEAGRLRAQSWVPENFEVPEFVCRPHAWDYSLEAGASRMRWVPEVHDPTQEVIAYHGRCSMREHMYPEYIARMKTFPRPKTVAGGGERGQ
jgi:hypothetical protein